MPNNRTDSAIFRASYQSDAVLEYGKSKRFVILEPVSIFESPESKLIGEVFPNPADSRTNLQFELEQPFIVSIDLIDISGAVVKKLLANYSVSSGHQLIELDVTGIATGRYYLLINVNGNYALREIVINK